jgi:hypothetical protein
VEHVLATPQGSLLIVVVASTIVAFVVWWIVSFTVAVIAFVVCA